MAMTGGTAKLVKTGYGGGDTSFPIKLYVYYKTSQSISTNKSTITVGMYVTTPSGWDIGSWTDYNGSYVGTKSLTFDGSIPNFDGTRWLVENKTFTVTHDDDGTGEATIYWKWGVNSPWGRMENPSGSFTITLPTIARKSTVSCPTSGTMKSNVTIGIDRKSTTAFTHTLKYTFGGTTATIESGVNAASYTWTVPDLASKCNNAKSGTCTITCETYSGSTKVGTTTDTMTLNVPAATTPTFSASSAKMGTSVTINTSRNSSNFTHTLSYSFGGATGTIATGVGTSKAWTVPDLAAYCSNATSGTCTVTCKTYNGTALVGTKTNTLTLNVQDASVPTLSESTVAMGSSLTIYTNRESSNFTHLITYSFNGATGDIGKHTTQASWPVDIALAKKIPSATSGKGTITCKTYNGTALVGTKTVEFTATVPNNSTTQPTFSAFDLTPSGSIPSTFSGLYIQGKTGVQASFTASSTYSSISSYKMIVGGATYSGNPATSGLFTAPGSKTIKGTVTDARGYSTSVSKTVTVLPYSKPTVVPYSGERMVICERCTSDGTLSDSGMYLRIKAGRYYYKVMSGETQKNFCTLGYRYKVSSATSYSSDVILIATDGTHKHPSGTVVVSTSDNNDEINVAIPGIVESIVTSYDVQIFVKDTMGETEEYTVRIPTAGADFHLRKGGKGAAFGKYSEIKNGVEFEWDVYGRAYGLGRLIPIPENADLNDEKYRVFGCYAITQSAIAETISNLPYPYAGILRVYSATGSGNVATDAGWIYIAQEYEPYYGTGRFRRLAHRDGTDAEWEFDAWRAVGGLDSVVSSGSTTTSAGITWHFKKWFNGTAECWARRSVDVDATTQWGSALYYGSASAVSLPFEFAEPPVCHISVEKGTSTSSNAFFVASSGQATTTTAPSVLLCRPTSATGINVNVIYSIHGRWK